MVGVVGSSPIEPTNEYTDFLFGDPVRKKAAGLVGLLLGEMVMTPRTLTDIFRGDASRGSVSA